MRVFRCGRRRRRCRGGAPRRCVSGSVNAGRWAVVSAAEATRDMDFGMVPTQLATLLHSLHELDHAGVWDGRCDSALGAAVSELLGEGTASLQRLAGRPLSSCSIGIVNVLRRVQPRDRSLLLDGLVGRLSEGCTDLLGLLSLARFAANMELHRWAEKVAPASAAVTRVLHKEPGLLTKVPTRLLPSVLAVIRSEVLSGGLRSRIHERVSESAGELAGLRMRCLGSMVQALAWQRVSCTSLHHAVLDRIAASAPDFDAFDAVLLLRYIAQCRDGASWPHLLSTVRSVATRLRVEDMNGQACASFAVVLTSVGAPEGEQGSELLRRLLLRAVAAGPLPLRWLGELFFVAASPLQCDGDITSALAATTRAHPSLAQGLPEDTDVAKVMGGVSVVLRKVGESNEEMRLLTDELLGKLESAGPALQISPADASHVICFVTYARAGRGELPSRVMHGLRAAVFAAVRDGVQGTPPSRISFLLRAAAECDLNKEVIDITHRIAEAPQNFIEAIPAVTYGALLSTLHRVHAGQARTAAVERLAAHLSDAGARGGS
eukprot:Hpha_TRINITY_DN18837_c0_g1::TRINITY_DN18837_c0_g1_i1::g.26243::m.26243